MGTTPKGYPYPEDTDPLAQGAAAIKALALAIDKQLGRGIASGSVAIKFGGTLAYASAVVTFPAGRFTAPPNVTATPVYSSVGSSLGNGATATSCTIYIRTFANSIPAKDTSYNAQWIAVGATT